jgi:hypothetical protein
MAQDRSEKFRILTELCQPPRPGTPEAALERGIRELFAAMRGRDGRIIDYDVARGKVNPLRGIATKLAKARRNGVPRSQALRLEAALREHIDRLWPEDGSELGTTR